MKIHPLVSYRLGMLTGFIIDAQGKINRGECPGETVENMIGVLQSVKGLLSGSHLQSDGALPPVKLLWVDRNWRKKS